MPEIPPFAAQVKSGYEMMLAVGFPAVAPKLSRGKSYSPKVMKSHFHLTRSIASACREISD
jgi:hypothetical protein